MKARDLAAIAVLGLLAATMTSGCFTTQLVRTDTMVSYDLIRAPEAPPPVPEDAVVLAPSSPPSGMTWMEPYWQWYGGQYTWVIGRWVPTLAGYHFLQPRWHATRDGWAMSGGGWADPSGHVIATPPPATARFGAVQCGAVAAPSSTPSTTTPPVAAPIAAADAPVEPPPRHRIDHTVVLGHRTYGRTRHVDEDVAPDVETEAVSSAWVTTGGARPTTSTPPITGGRYRSRPSSSPYGTSGYSSYSGSSSSSSSGSSSTSSRTGYSSSSTTSSAPSSSYGSGSFGSRTGYGGSYGTGSGGGSSRP